MKIINVEQGSAVWLSIRTGVLSASNATDFLSVKKDGSMTAAGKTLAHKLALERITGSLCDNFVGNTATQWGKDNESLAADAYEVRTGQILTSVGFVFHGELSAGCSPDRLICDDNGKPVGALEIKCPFSQTKVAEIWATGDVSEYEQQCKFQMYICNLQWVDIGVYDPRLSRSGLDLFVTRFERDESEMADIDQKTRKFLAYVDSIEAKIRAAANK
jgi:hypothetical protein